MAGEGRGVLLGQLPGKAVRKMREKGFTLVEMLVVLGLAGLALAALCTVYFGGERQWEAGSRLAELRQHARVASEEVANELMVAVETGITHGGTHLFYKKETGGELREYRFYLQGNQLLHGLPAGTAVPVASYVQDFGAEVTGALVTFWLTVGEGDASVSVRSSVLPRNL